jgi:hypothetical protein
MLLTILGSRIAFALYGAAIGWAVTHWTVVKTAEATLFKLLGSTETLASTTAPAPPAPPAA